MSKPQSQGAPGEVMSSPPDASAYSLVAEEQDDIRRPYQLPSKFTKEIFDGKGIISECPLIVFVNSRSGGRLGSDLTLAFHRNLGRAQVYDLSQHRPDKVLKRLWDNFEAARKAGDATVAEYQRRLRILVCGGDGTIAWVLSVIASLELEPTPPVAIMPMGTGNDLSRSLGWGPAFSWRWISSHPDLYKTLKRIADARVDSIDRWRIRMSLPSLELLSKTPYSLSCPDEGNKKEMNGLFWNYFSVGLDAKAAFRFHSLRNQRPYLTSGRLINQGWYSVFSCTSGWFCCTKPLSSRASLSVLNGEGKWEEMEIPSSVRALVVLNLQSYAGGRNLWGSEPSTGFEEPSTGDGKLEVVGLTNGWHTGLVMATKGGLFHAMRICQASGVKIELKAKHVRPDGAFSHAYMQIDGEPWRQDVPSARDERPVVVEIKREGNSKVLRYEGEKKMSQEFGSPTSSPSPTAP